jgi:hypothetical protein
MSRRTRHPLGVRSVSRIGRFASRRSPVRSRLAPFREGAGYGEQHKTRKEVTRTG